MSLSILYVGTESGTSLQRADGLRDLGHRVTFIDSGPPEYGTWMYQVYRVAHRFRRYPDLFRAGKKLVAAVVREPFDILWVDKGLMLRPADLARAREMRPDMKLVTYSPDDMMNRANQTERYLGHLPLHDLVVTTKSYNVPELAGLGARKVLFVGNAYDPAIHRPMELTPEERRRYSADVGFIGAWEQERADSMLQAAEAGIRVTIHGPGWGRYRDLHPNLTLGKEYLAGPEYSKVINATRINLGFLRKINRDLQTTRSIEIPACGAFMLAERTQEHLQLFREGVEAEFFDSDREMIEKCRHYLEHEDARRSIAAAGLERCRDSGYSNQGRLSSILDAVRSEA